MRYRHFIIGLFLLSLAFACTKKLSKSELADVLVDMYIYDQLYNCANMHRQDSISIYRSVFQKHNCTAEQFRNSITRYGANPKHLKEVFDEADKKIKVLKTGYSEVVDALHKERAFQLKMDSLYRYPSDTMYRHIFKHCWLWEHEFAFDIYRSAAADTTVVTADTATVDVARRIIDRKAVEMPLERVFEEAVEMKIEKLVKETQ
jgi:hypothetical protein